VTFVIVATANHFVLDAVLGASSPACRAQRAVARTRRPTAWGFPARPQVATS
jgi:hypothetical protein